MSPSQTTVDDMQQEVRDVVRFLERSAATELLAIHAEPAGAPKPKY